MRRLPLIDVALLAALVPLWVGAFTLHLKEVVQGRLALVGVFVSRPEGPSGLPHVTALWPAAEVQRAGLVPGDRLLSLARRRQIGGGHLHASRETSRLLRRDFDH